MIGRAIGAHGDAASLGFPLDHIGIGLQERIVLDGLLGGRSHGVLAVEIPGPALEDGSQRLGNSEAGKSRRDVCRRERLDFQTVLPSTRENPRDDGTIGMPRAQHADFVIQGLPRGRTSRPTARRPV